jgi:hypothetical protein
MTIVKISGNKMGSSPQRRTRTWSARLAGAALIAGWLGASAPALAQSNDAATAEALFQEAQKLIDAGKIAEACPKFAASHRIDPGYGALFNLADCHEKNGQTASAWAEFREAVAMAKKAGEAPREEKAARRAAALEPKLVRIVVSVKGAPQGLVVKLDGAVLDPAAWSTPVPVDPGAHTVEATAPDKKTWNTKVQVIKEGEVVTVELPALAAGDPAAAQPAGKEPAAPNQAQPAPAGDPGPQAVEAGGFPAQRGVAIAVAGVGVAGIVVGTIFGLGAKSKWDDAQENHCDASDVCDAEGVELAGDARTSAHVSTAGFVVGGVGIAGAVVLWLTAEMGAPAPASGLRVVPALGARSAGMLVGGTF